MPKPPGNTGKKRGKRAELDAWIAEKQPVEIGEPEFIHLMQVMEPVAESYLRKLLRECGVELSPLVGGVRQSNLDELECSLNALLAEYVNGGAESRAKVRLMVITAKEHARFAARRKEKQAEKEEMILWLLTWLENPPVFPDWVRLRREHQSDS